MTGTRASDYTFSQGGDQVSKRALDVRGLLIHVSHDESEDD